VPARDLRLAATVESALATVALGLFVVWAVRDGGYAPEEWLPGGLLSLGLLCVSLASADVRARLRARRAPLVLFGLYVAWSYVSIAWAQVPGDAVDGANRTLVYWLVFTLFCGLALGRWGTTLVLGWGGAVAVVGMVSLLRAATATRPAGHFVLGRLAAPISYPDADAALFLSTCLPLLALASRRGTSLAVRVAAGTAAVVLADLAVLCESRGSAIVLPLALLLYLAATRSRLRALVHIVVLAAAAAPAVPALLAVEGAVVRGASWTGAVGHAAVWIGVCAALGAVAFALLALLDRRLHVGAEARAAIGRVLLLAAGAALLVAAAVVIAFAHPISRAETAWRNFTTNQEAAPGTTPHFAAGLGTSRYDVWRIALRQFSAHPLTGVGADNYLVGYLRHRRTHEVSRYPSSLELRALSETGVMGAVLFFGFLATALLQVWTRARRSRAPNLALACLVGSGYWLLHASFDWFWEFPALTGPGLALLALGGASSRAPGRRRAARDRPRFLGSARLAVAAAAAALAAAAVLAVPWVAVSLTDEAVALGPTTHAYGLLETAASLNPFSEQPALARAAVAAGAGERGRERRALHDALQRSPSDWYARFMLGIVAGQEHRPALARAELERAHRLSPEDLVVVYAQRRLAIGKPLSERRVAAILREVTATFRGERQR
jgi:hypothetical protein